MQGGPSSPREHGAGDLRYSGASLVVRGAGLGLRLGPSVAVGVYLWPAWARGCGGCLWFVQLPIPVEKATKVS